MNQPTQWQAVIGLEIHAELNTRSKLFSEAPNRFGDEPNTNISEVCTGQPGALPVLNKEAVKKAVQFGLAINAQVAKFSKFDRKSYFYPDSPRNFQITQFDEPIVIGGVVTAEVEGVEMHFAVHHVHLEDDAGMLKHFPAFAGVDYNRAGVPLIEIVSEPCMHTPKEAAAYAIAVKAILQYIDASDCNMEEGSLRVDANISVRIKGEKELRNKIEIKNMNSFSNMEIALEAEIKRQIREYTAHPQKPYNEVITQATYRFDPEKKETVMMRKKEGADDYRYFPEPDLLPIQLTDAYIEAIRKDLPELPLQREKRYIQELQLSPQAAFVITSDKGIADYFEEALKYAKSPKLVCNWIIVEFAGRLKDTGKTLLNVGIPAKHLGKLVQMIESGQITGRIAKDVADDMLKSIGTDPEEIVKANPDYSPMNDHGEIEKFVDAVLLQNVNQASGENQESFISPPSMSTLTGRVASTQSSPYSASKLRNTTLISRKRKKNQVPNNIDFNDHNTIAPTSSSPRKTPGLPIFGSPIHPYIGKSWGNSSVECQTEWTEPLDFWNDKPVDDSESPSSKFSKFKNILTAIGKVALFILKSMVTFALFVTNPPLFSIGLVIGFFSDQQTKEQIDKIGRVWNAIPFPICVVGVASFIHPS